MRNSKVYQAVCLITAFFVIGMVTSACAQSAHQPSASAGSAAQNSGKVVIKVGNVQVTQNEFESVLGSMSQQQINQNGGRNAIGENYANMLLLSQAAASQHLDSSPVFKQQLEQARNNLLARMEGQDIAQKAVVTPTEINQYYTAHTAEFKEAKVYEVALIKKTASNDKGLTATEAQTRAQAIRKALSSGEDIGAVAKQFNVPNQVDVVTEPQSIQNKDTLPAFAKAAFTMQNGALSEVEDRPDALLFYKVAGHDQVALKDATPQIETKLRQEKFLDALGTLKKQIPVWMDPAYFGSESQPHGAAGSHP
ncbi:MAG: peptidyl-prolyl cis-trans isomerase [Terriglobia bacterium]